MKFSTCVLGLLLLAAVSVEGTDRLTMTVSPAVAFAPADLFVSTFVSSDASNRALEVIADSPDFYRSSETQLDGDRAAKTHTVEFHDMPSGVYQVTAVLRGPTNEEIASVTRKVKVVALDATDVP
jgi:hypothetical protein